MRRKSWLLLTALMLASCRGGVKPTVQESIGVLPIPKLKLSRTQGGNRYDEVKCGLQDKAGNLWFGTTGEGVYRFDGKSFIQYTIQDGLSSNTVWSILEDRQGRIWFGTDSGLSRWDGKSISSVPISSALVWSVLNLSSPSGAFTGKAAVWSMLEDKRGTIWIGTGEGVLFYKDGVISSFLGQAMVQNPTGLHLKMVDDILEDRHGNIWFASGMPPGMEGLARFDGTSVQRFNPGGAKWIRTVKEDSRGVLWVGTRNQGVWLYDGKAFSRHSEPLELGEPLLVDRSGNIWFSGVEHDNGFESKTGIWRYDGKAFRNFSTTEGMDKYFAWCAVEDRDGNIWVGTRNMGLYRFDGKSFARLSE